MATTLKLKPIVHLNREQFAQLCQANEECLNKKKQTEQSDRPFLTIDLQAN
jgi:hypothetical protein